MSSQPVVAVFMALTSFLVLPGMSAVRSAQAQAGSVADLLLKMSQQAESLLAKQPRTAESLAFRGEIEFRQGHFDQAETLYRDALKMDSKNARAHFGMGKLALAKVKPKRHYRNSTERSNWIQGANLPALRKRSLGRWTKTIPSSENSWKNICELNPADEDRVDGSKGRARDAQSLRNRGSGRGPRSGETGSDPVPEIAEPDLCQPEDRRQRSL